MSTLPVAQAQNLVLWSENLTHFTKILLTTPSPTRMLESNDGAPVQHYFAIANPAITAGVTCTIKIVCKSASRWLYMSHGGGLQWCYLNPITGAVGTKTAGLTITSRAVGSNWEFTIVGASNVATSSWLLFMASGDNGVSYQGNGTGYVDVFQLQRTHANWTGPYVQSAGAYVLGPIRNVAEPVPVVNKVAGLAASWTAGNSAVLTDVASTRPGAPAGEMALRITRNGVNSPYAAKAALATAGQYIMTRGWMRTSADFYSYVTDNNITAYWVGSASGSWQPFQATAQVKSGGTGLGLIFGGTAGSGWAEYARLEFYVLNTTPTRFWAPKAQNLLSVSNKLGTAPWAPYGVGSLTITENTLDVIDPWGGNTACKLTAAGAGIIYHQVMQTKTNVQPIFPRDVCVSVLVRAGTARYALVGSGGHQNWFRTWFDFNTNTISANDAGVRGTATQLGSTEWWVVNAFFTLNRSDALLADGKTDDCYVGPAMSNGVANFIQAGETIYIANASMSLSNNPGPLVVTTIPTPGPIRSQAVVPAVQGASGPMYRKRNDGLVGLWDERGHAGDFSQWDDQSGRGNHLFQATAGNRFSAGPLIKGLTTMLSPDGKYMLNANRLDLRPDTGLLLTAVFRVGIANATYNHICGWGDTWPSGYGLTRVVGFGGGGWVDNASGTGTSYTALPAVGAVSVLSVRYDGIVQAAKLNLSAEAPIARVGNVDYSTGPLLPNFLVGALSRLVAGRYLNGVLCEVRLYADRKTAAFTTAVHTELTAKWL